MYFAWLSIDWIVSQEFLFFFFLQLCWKTFLIPVLLCLLFQCAEFMRFIWLKIKEQYERAIHINKFIAYFHWSNSLVLHNNNKHFAAIIILCAVLADLLLCEWGMWQAGRLAAAAAAVAAIVGEVCKWVNPAVFGCTCHNPLYSPRSFSVSVCVCVRDFMFLQMA